LMRMHPNQIDVMNHYEVASPAVAEKVGEIMDALIEGDYESLDDLLVGCDFISDVIRRDMNGNEDFEGPVPTPDFVLMWCVSQSAFKVSRDILRELEEFEC